MNSTATRSSSRTSPAARSASRPASPAEPVWSTSMPVALGFGISRPEHVAEVGAYADAAVVGSALVSLIAEASGSPRLIERVEAYVRDLKHAAPAPRT